MTPQHVESNSEPIGTGLPLQHQDTADDTHEDKADGGKQAWIFLAAASVMLQLTWGLYIPPRFRIYSLRADM